MGFADNALTCDGFLGGKLRILQPRAGYRAATDPVFLAATVPAQAGQSVLELGCGAGVALLSLGRRVPGLQLFGVELQPDYADLAQRNAAANGVACTIHCADLTQMPADLRTQNFDHVIANPPYFPKASGTAAADSGRETAPTRGAGAGHMGQNRAAPPAPRWLSDTDPTSRPPARNIARSTGQHTRAALGRALRPPGQPGDRSNPQRWPRAVSAVGPAGFAPWRSAYGRF